AFLISTGKALDPLVAVSIAGGMIQPDGFRIERAQAPHRLDREAGGTGQFFGGRHAAQAVLEQRSGTPEAAQVRRAVERHPDRAPMPRDGRLDRLADPPDRVGNELDAAIRIELPGRRHEAKIALADQVHEWQDRKSTRLNSSHVKISYAVFCLKKK